MKYTFLRTVRYTETIEVQADSYEEAKKIALHSEDAEHNNDDIVEDIELIKSV